jgi:hypothetical protein
MRIHKLLKFFLYGLLFIAVLFNSSLSASAQSANVTFTDSTLTAKVFPLLSLIQQNSRLQKAMQKDEVFQNISAMQYKRTSQSIQTCNLVSCYADSLKWIDKEIDRIGTELIRLYKTQNDLRNIISLLRKQGSYAFYEASPDTTYLRNAWNDAAKGINRIFDVYIKSSKPRYSAIDSISFKRGDLQFKQQIQNSTESFLQKNDQNQFITSMLRTALSVLKINGRDEATRYEPLNVGLNQQPVLKVKATRFPDYPYSVILIPGSGPDKPGEALNAKGAKRCEDGVLRYRKGLAPFIVVSGGHVHPFRTPYCEAVEMEKYMVEKLGVPADVILIEPHARHTTTNLRNTSRMIYRFGLPSDKPVLIVTDSSQSTYIVEQMDKTAIRDLGYIPWSRLKKLSEEETEFYPSWNCLQVDPIDPLDP